MNNAVSSPFMINNGLKQGDVMSPVLFNIALESVIRKILQTEMLNLDKGNNLLAYADDMMVIGKSRKDIQNTVKELIKVGKNISLTINSGKAGYMMVKQRGNDHNNLHIGNNN